MIDVHQNATLFDSFEYRRSRVIGNRYNEDNQGAIAMAKNPVGHARTKHIDIRYHFVREGVQNGAIFLNYVATDEMIADILTKPLPKHPFEKLVIGLGMKTVK